MGDPGIGEALAMPPLDPDFFSDLFSDDIDFSSDDFSLLDLLLPPDASLSPSLAVPFTGPGAHDHVAGPCHVSPHPETGPGINDDVAGPCHVSSSYPETGSWVPDDVAGFGHESSHEENSKACDDVAGFGHVSLSSESGFGVSSDVADCMNVSSAFRVSSDVAGFVNASSPEENSRVSADVAGYLNVSPDSGVFADVAGFGNVNPSPVSSGNSVNFDTSNNSPNSVLFNDSSKDAVKLEEESNNSALKRKKDEESEIRTSKHRRPSYEDQAVIPGEDEKRKARLVRNRESAQLSRQRKKHYVEELEEKVKLMQSTIHDLNTKISYVMAENASLRMQANGMPPPGMYPPVGYPWPPYPPYMVKGSSQVPLVPIPRLKPQKVLPKVQKSEGKSKTKKVASVSFLGLLLFVVLFGGFVPMVNLKFSEYRDSSEHFGNGRYSSSVNVNGSDTKIGIGNDFDNSSEPLFASLYVPRNDKLVKIDGNLIIQSVLASEKAMGSSGRRSEETSLAVARNNVPNIIPLTGRNGYPYPYRGERRRALGGEKDKLISSTVDGNNDLHEWFIDGLAGPMLSSGMCTEVFQFDVLPGAIVPATTFTNVSSESQHLNNVTNKHVKGNRRILHRVSVPLESKITEKPMGMDSEKDKLRGNSSLSSMVVSVLVDPREVGDGGGDGMRGPKSLSRIFVVVLIDSVKYVTYSCMLPLRGSSAHLVTT